MEIKTGIGFLILEEAVKSFTPKKARIVLKYVAEGYTIKQIKKQGLISEDDNIFAWCEAFEDFNSEFQKALKIGASNMAMNVLDIADDLQLKPEDRKIMIGARQWVASKHNDIYQDRQVVKQEDHRALSHEQLESKKTELINRVAQLIQSNHQGE